MIYSKRIYKLNKYYVFIFIYIYKSIAMQHTKLVLPSFRSRGAMTKEVVIEYDEDFQIFIQVNFIFKIKQL